MIRNPAVAGRFYPQSAAQLRAQLKPLIDEKAEKKEAIGIVVPHAAYIASGAVAGAVISRIVFKDTFVIIGPNHTGRGLPFSIMTEGKWKTPLGEVEIDTKLAKQILETSQYLEEDAQAHEYEHAVEIQLPLLQYIKPDMKFVPIIVASATGDIYREIGEGIARAMKKLKKDAVIIASGDFTHYEPHETAQKKDAKAVEAILALDAGMLLERVKRYDISMCCDGPAAVLIGAAKELGANKAELIRYATSGDALGDFSSVVGYAGIIIRK